MEILHDSTKYLPSDDPVQLDTSWSTLHVLKAPGAMAKYKRKDVQSDNKAGLTTTNSS
jgi:hypothetical protein